MTDWIVLRGTEKKFTGQILGISTKKIAPQRPVIKTLEATFSCFLMVCDPARARTWNLLLSIPATAFAASEVFFGVCGLDYLFTVSGVSRIVSTEPSYNHQQD